MLIWVSVLLAWSTSQVIKVKSYARVGLLGNPSDGFNGRTIAATVSNYFAEITIFESRELHLVPHPLYVVVVVVAWVGGLTFIRCWRERCWLDTPAVRAWLRLSLRRSLTYRYDVA